MDEETWPAVRERLLMLGRPEGFKPSDWERSIVPGMTREHVPNLIGVLDDQQFDDEMLEEPDFYAPVHAWRALGHFKAVDAVDSLIRCLDVRQRWSEFDDWSLEEVPRVLCAIGPDAIAAMVKATAHPTTEPFSAGALAEALSKIAAAHPDHRETIVAHLIDLGEGFAGRAHEANDGILVALMGLKAVEAAPLLRRMFHADAVSKQMVGDWGDVRRELKLDRQDGDPPERRPGESLHDPDSPIAKVARLLDSTRDWESIDGPPADAPPAAPVKHTGKWHRKQARKHKQQTRRC